MGTSGRRLAVLLGILLAGSPGASRATEVLFYGPTYSVSCAEATAPGINITIWDAATWSTKTTADFTVFDAIVFADLDGIGLEWGTAIGNRSEWSAAIDGNVIVIGSDPNGHTAFSPGATALARDGVSFAAAAGSGKTGLYVALSHAYEVPTPTTVDLLADLGIFTAMASGANEVVHKTADHPALGGVTDASLSYWGVSTHDAFLSWPFGFVPLAIAVNPLGTYLAPDGIRGDPYILARGATLTCSAEIAVSVLRTPAAPRTGDRVTYAIVVTNLGIPVSGMWLADTLPAALTGVVATAPPGFTLQGPATTAAGEWYGWSGTGLSLATGVSLTFTLTGMVPASCSSTPLVHTAQATAVGSCGWPVTVTAGQVNAIAIPPVVSLSVAATRTPAVPQPGVPLSYRIVTLNTGTATITELTVIGTVPPVLAVQVAGQPPAFSAPLVTHEPGAGTRYEWSATGLSLSPGATFTFTVTGTTGAVCAATWAGHRAGARATDDCGSSAAAFVPDAGFLLPGPGMSLNLTQSPGTRAPGAIVSWRIVVTNSGSTTLTNLTVTDTVPALVTEAAWSLPPGFTVSPPEWIASGTWYVVSGAGLPPQAVFTITLTGVLGEACAGTPVPSAIRVTGSDFCGGQSLAQWPSFAVSGVRPDVMVQVAQDPAGPAIGDPVSYRIVVTNTGTLILTGLTVTDTMSAVVLAPVRDAPPGFMPLGPAGVGSASWYGWTGTGLSIPPGMALTFTVTGIVGEVCASTRASATVFVRASTACTATTAIAGVTGFTALPLPVSIAVVSIQAPASGSALATGAPVAYGVLVTNTGISTITALTVIDTISPVVLGQVASAPAGFTLAQSGTGSGSLWIWTGTGLAFRPGTTLSLTVTGTVGSVCTGQTVTAPPPTALADTGCSTTLVRGSAVAFTVQPYAPGLTTAVTATPAAPEAGQTVTYRIMVTNTGGVTMTDLLVVDTVSPVVMNATASQPGAMPPPLVTQGATGTVFSWSGAGLSFEPGTTWTFTVTGLVWIVGTDTTVANRALASAGGACASVVSASSSTAFFIPVFIPATLVVDSLTLSPVAVPLGTVVTATLVVRNAGGTDLSITDLNRFIGSGSTAGLGPPSPSLPAVPITLAGGAQATLTWTHTTGGICGTAFVGAAPVGTEAVTGRTVTAATARSNPVGLAGIPVQLTLAPSAPSAVADTRTTLVARVTDQCGVGVPGVTLRFAVVTGAGSLTAPVLLTDTNGQALPELRLDAEPGPNAVRASLDTPGLSATAVVTGTSNPLALTSPGSALSANVIRPEQGEIVFARIFVMNADPVTARVFTASGRLVRTLRGDGFRKLESGHWLAAWDGRTEDEFIVARGVYLIHITGGGLNQVLKLIVK